LSKSASRARLAEIIRKRSFGRGEITLASGRKSDFYFNLKPTMLDPEGAALLAELTFEALKDDRLDFDVRLDMSAVPLAGGSADMSWLRAIRSQPSSCASRRSMAPASRWRAFQGRACGQAHRRRGRHHHRRLGAEGRSRPCAMPAAGSCWCSP
jgi:orotate phosphoribosyltransferase